MYKSYAKNQSQISAANPHRMGILEKNLKNYGVKFTCFYMYIIALLIHFVNYFLLGLNTICS